MGKTSKTTKTSKTVTKKSVKKDVKKAVKSTGNKILDGILKNIADAKKAGAKSVVVFTTNESHHKANTSLTGFGVNDLKPKVLEAYKHIFCKYDVSTNLVDLSTKSVEWIVKLK